MKRKKNSSNSSAQFCPDVSFGNINYLDLSLKHFDVRSINTTKIILYPVLYRLKDLKVLY